MGPVIRQGGQGEQHRQGGIKGEGAGLSLAKGEGGETEVSQRQEKEGQHFHGVGGKGRIDGADPVDQHQPRYQQHDHRQKEGTVEIRCRLPLAAAAGGSAAQQAHCGGRGKDAQQDMEIRRKNGISAQAREEVRRAGEDHQKAADHRQHQKSTLLCGKRCGKGLLFRLGELAAQQEEGRGQYHDQARQSDACRVPRHGKAGLRFKAGAVLDQTQNSGRRTAPKGQCREK